MEVEALRAIEAYGSGVRTTLRNNATAYGFSISVTAAFGLLASSHQQASFPLQALLFAGGAVDALSVLASVGAASALSLVPGVAAWPLTAFVATLAYLLVGGMDVLIARRVARTGGPGKHP